MTRRSLSLVSLAMLALATFLAGCQTNPVTGRKGLALFPESTLQEIASSQFSDLKQQLPVSTDPERTESAVRVSHRIIVAAREAGYPLDPPEAWEIVVFDQPDTINAFAMPGNKIGVYTGMWRVFEQEDDMAVVLGHEVAHVISRHAAERISTQLATSLGAIAIGSAIPDEDIRNAALALYSIGGTLGNLGYSRTHENEADEIGLEFMARAGYDPRRAVPFWQNMAAASGGGSRPPEFLSTHPSPETRVERIQQKLPEVMPLYQQALASP
ncbi:MAG: M48 family metallopeptidase [Opitutales bacterium]